MALDPISARRVESQLQLACFYRTLDSTVDTLHNENNSFHSSFHFWISFARGTWWKDVQAWWCIPELDFLMGKERSGVEKTWDVFFSCSNIKPDSEGPVDEMTESLMKWLWQAALLERESILSFRRDAKTALKKRAASTTFLSLYLLTSSRVWIQFFIKIQYNCRLS